MEVTLKPIGCIQSCYREKFGIPRQPNLVTEARASLWLEPPFTLDAVRGLEAFSHVWLIFLFHTTEAQGWHMTVRPPRLGGNKRVGVFATRSTFRPNALGLSVVKLEQIQLVGAQVVLGLSGMELLDGTPVLDIKPYIPYADAIPAALAGFAQQAPPEYPVVFSEQARMDCTQKSAQWNCDINLLIRQILAQDPRPAYRAHDGLDTRRYAMKLYDFDVHWQYTTHGIEVLRLNDLS